MNDHFRPPLDDKTWHKRRENYKLLDEVRQDLDLTKEQSEKAKETYGSISLWMASSLNPLLADMEVYPQGSTALGTATRPLGRDEFDVDLICLMPRGHSYMSPEDIKKAVGDRLRVNSFYENLLEEKKRCWRLNYAGDFHLDLSPTIPNVSCVANGELIPDKKLRGWHPTNPRGYREVFKKRAMLNPRMRRAFSDTRFIASAKIEPFPDHSAPKGVLRVVVQLLKRHRDQHFLNVKEDIAPISIIITTLAMRSYQYCVENFIFDDELDVLISTIRMMPLYIEKEWLNGRRHYSVLNESTEGENFADRWNSEPARATAFYKWHEKALSDFEALRDAEGLDKVVSTATQQFGSKIMNRVMSARTEKITKARTTRFLSIAPTVGLVTTTAAASTSVAKNTFFGD